MRHSTKKRPRQVFVTLTGDFARPDEAGLTRDLLSQSMARCLKFGGGLFLLEISRLEMKSQTWQESSGTPMPDGGKDT